MNASLIIFSHVLTSRYRSEKREEVNKHILKEEEEKAKIQKDLSILTDRLSQINESLARKAQARNEYDKTIQETEAAYMKVRKGPSGFLFFILFLFYFFLLRLFQFICDRLRPISLPSTHLPFYHPSLRNRLLLDFGVKSDSAACPQEGNCQPYQEKAELKLT